MQAVEAYHPDRSWRGKLRRRLVRLAHRKPAHVNLARPMVSFSFDDAPLSAATTGAALLEARGLRGTYYVAAGLAGRDGPMGRYADHEDISRLAAAGHEIACHTYSHLDCGQTDAIQLADEIDLNEAILTAWGAAAPTSFAYPYGDVSGVAKAALDGRFTTLRALHHGLVETGSDLNQAPAVGIEGPGGEALAQLWIAQAAAKKAWVILYTHDVAEQPSEWGCTPEALARIVDAAVGLGCEVVTVAEGAGRVAAEVVR